MQHLIRAANVAGLNLPKDVRNFCYRDAPRFHSLALGTIGCDLTDDQYLVVAGFVAAQDRPDCAPRVTAFVERMLAGDPVADTAG